MSQQPSVARIFRATTKEGNILMEPFQDSARGEQTSEKAEAPARDERSKGSFKWNGSKIGWLGALG